jgi:ABC-type multidrug transport system fused ATPase/permease subunit
MSDALIFLFLLGIYEVLQGRWIEWYREYQRTFPKIESLWNIFDTLPPLHNYFEGSLFSGVKQGIRVENITFSYPENKQVFSNFSLEIPVGKTTALVGPSGGGKTTLLKILAGYLEIQAGEIYFDSTPLSKLAKQSYFHHIGYLSQDPSVFDGTILENLLYGVADISEVSNDILHKAIHDAACDFIFDFPQ